LALEAQALFLLLERMVAIQYFQRLLLLAVGAVVELEVKMEQMVAQVAAVLPIILLLQQEELDKQDKDLQVEQDLLTQLQPLAEAVEVAQGQLEQMEQFQVVQEAELMAMVEMV
jgi:hypothetical protein